MKLNESTGPFTQSSFPIFVKIKSIISIGNFMMSDIYIH